jgi:hypothetical protein
LDNSTKPARECAKRARFQADLLLTAICADAQCIVTMAGRARRRAKRHHAAARFSSPAAARLFDRTKLFCTVGWAKRADPPSLAPRTTAGLESAEARSAKAEARKGEGA